MQNSNHDLELKFANWDPFIVSGRIKRLSGYIIEATGIRSNIGSLWRICEPEKPEIVTEVIGFNGSETYLMSFDSLVGVSPEAKIIPISAFATIPVGDGLLGRVIDANGAPMDSLGNLSNIEYHPIRFKPMNPLHRDLITTPLDVGVKAINGLLTLGKGQRMGLFAGSGVGKSVLLGMMAKYTKADVVIISLVGERAREVKDFIHDHIHMGAKKTVVIAAPAGSSPLARIRAAEGATFIAEYFKNKSKHVLLLMDSITRYAQALRELGLSLGEPPTAKGYPPSVFTKIPQLVERVSNGNHANSSITGIYTVLVEADDLNDPIADAARGILDGHIVLSRELADLGHYPAIDIEKSISRIMNKVVSVEHQKFARNFKKLYAKYRQNIDYINLGAYQKGADPEIDYSHENRHLMYGFLQQEFTENVDLTATIKILSDFNHMYDKYDNNKKLSG